MQRSVDWSYCVMYVSGKVITLTLTILHLSRGEHFTINNFAPHVTIKKLRVPNYYPRQGKLEPGSYWEKYSACIHWGLKFGSDEVKQNDVWLWKWQTFYKCHTCFAFLPPPTHLANENMLSYFNELSWTNIYWNNDCLSAKPQKNNLFVFHIQF